MLKLALIKSGDPKQNNETVTNAYIELTTAYAVRGTVCACSGPAGLGVCTVAGS